MGDGIKFSPEQLSAISEAVTQANNFTENKIKQAVSGIQWIMAGVVIVCLIGFIQMVMDSAHYNSAVYTEYSEKLDAIKDLRETNESLEKQITQNQALIENQQSKILEITQQIPTQLHP